MLMFIILFLFEEFMFQDIEVSKNSNSNLGKYPGRLSEHFFNVQSPYIFGTR
jgi:hypothetical protein